MAAPMFSLGSNIFLKNHHKFRFLIRQLPKTLSRYARRRPVAVFTQKQHENLQQKTIGKKPDESSHTKAWQGAYGNDMPSIHGRDEEGAYTIPPHIKYITLEEGDKRFGPVINLAKSRKGRYKSQLILLEGRHLLEEALAANMVVKSIFFTSGKHLKGLPLDEIMAKETALFKVKMKHMGLWSDLTFPPGIMAVCRMPGPGVCSHTRETVVPLTMVCDEIRDPGVMGTLLRSAAGVGCQSVVVTKGCVDVWEPKVLRAGCGCHFRVPLLNNISWELLSNYLEKDSRIFLADCGSEATIDVEPTSLSKADQKRIMNHNAPAIEEFTAENDTDRMVVQESFLDTDLLGAFEKVHLASRRYSDVDFTGSHTVVIVSGDSGEASAQSKLLSYERHGERICLPLAAGVDRLNPAVAASLIMFEVKRQVDKCGR